MNATRLFDSQKGEFRFELGLQRGSADFFRHSPFDTAALAERVRWLRAEADRYARALPESEDLLAEAVKFAQTVNPEMTPPAGPDAASLGRVWAPDFLLLQPDAQKQVTLRAACVCFPSYWDLGEKMGLPMAEIHSPVPTLNASLGKQVDAFLSALKPGIFWERWNWGLAATPERNNHPSRELPRLVATTPFDDVYLRAEHQSFTRLPETGAVLFGIRLVIEPLVLLVSESGVKEGLFRLLRSMSPEIAKYKGLAQARGSLLHHLQMLH